MSGNKITKTNSQYDEDELETEDILRKEKEKYENLFKIAINRELILKKNYMKYVMDAKKEKGKKIERNKETLIQREKDVIKI